MNCPETAREAAEMIEKKAKELGLSVAAFCREKGVSPSAITRWREQYSSYRISTFLKLMK